MGRVLGAVTTPDGTPFDTDGTGSFGFVDVPTGGLNVLVDTSRVNTQPVEVFTVTAGEVATVDLTPEPKGNEKPRHLQSKKGRDPGERQAWPNGER